MRSCLLVASSVFACAPAGANTVTIGAHVPGAVLLRNHSEEVVCEVSLVPAGTGQERDRLGPAEVIPPGGGRDWMVPPGRYDLRIRSCARRILWARDNVEVSEAGVVLTFRERE